LLEKYLVGAVVILIKILLVYVTTHGVDFCAKPRLFVFVKISHIVLREVCNSNELLWLLKKLSELSSHSF